MKTIEIPVFDNEIQTNRSLDNKTLQNSYIYKDLLKDNPQINSIIPEDIELIDNLNDLLKYLSEVIIRFDTNPNYYTQKDYRFLIQMLLKSLIFLYQNISGKTLNIVTSWSSELLDTNIPSEKLVKNTIDQKLDKPKIEGKNNQILTYSEDGVKWTDFNLQWNIL